LAAGRISTNQYLCYSIEEVKKPLPRPKQPGKPSARQARQPKKLVNPATGKTDGRCREWKPLDPLVVEFMVWLRATMRSDRTVREYVRDVELFGAFLQGREPTGANGLPYRGPFGSAFVDATETSVMQFVIHLGELRHSAAAIRRRLAVLRRFFGHLKTQRRRPDNPAVGILNIPLPKRLPKAIPLRDVMTLIGTRGAAGQPEDRWRRDYAILELFYASGVRRAELVGINVADVDFSDRTIRVIGKGNKERFVFFNRATAAALKAYLRVRRRSKDGALFVSRQGRRLSYQQVGRLFAGYVALSGLEGKITPHTMRHSVATHLHQSGVDLMTIKDFLGHASIQTTQIYAQMKPAHVKRSYEKHHPRDQQVLKSSGLARRLSDDE
jgi:site-specific recombinase XerD